MIVVDSSAIIAIVLHQSDGPFCRAILEGADQLSMSAGTFAETLIVAERRGLRESAAALIAVLGVEVVPVTEFGARLAADAHARWGRGAGTAGLNFGDCFAYALAAERNCPLLFVGDDFRKTDVTPAL